MTAIGKIERLLPEAGLNKASLAAKVGIAPSTISRIEAPYDKMEFGTCRRIARALGVTVDWLFDDKQAWPPPESARVVIYEADRRFIGLENEIPPSMTREQILQAILEHRLKHVADAPATVGPSGAGDQAKYRRAKDLRPDQKRPGEGKPRPGEAQAS